MKTILITGITGQDGSYLAEFLLEKVNHKNNLKNRAANVEKYLILAEKLCFILESVPKSII